MIPKPPFCAYKIGLQKKNRYPSKSAERYQTNHFYILISRPVEV